MQTVSSRPSRDGYLGTFRQHFAHNLAVALRGLGLNNQKKQAKALGVSEPTLSTWLNGDKIPRDDATWLRITTVLHTSYDALLRDPELPPDDPWLAVLRREAEAKGYTLVKAKPRRTDQGS